MSFAERVYDEGSHHLRLVPVPDCRGVWVIDGLGRNYAWVTGGVMEPVIHPMALDMDQELVKRALYRAVPART